MRRLRRRGWGDDGLSLERQNAGMEFLRAVVLVEGVSDKVALETLAVRRGRNLAAEGVSVMAIGGAQAIGRFLDLYGPHGSNVGLAGFCDAGEERAFRRALERAGLGDDLDRAGMERLGFFVCERDLEDELVRCLGAQVVEEILAVNAAWRVAQIFRRDSGRLLREGKIEVRR